MSSTAYADLSYLLRLLRTLPMSTVEFSFGYGSGVYSQANQDPSKNMVDFVLSVSDSQQFHAENVKLNPGHYSWMRFLGAKRLSRFQRNSGASVFFNTLVKIPDVPGQLIKYGVVETKDLIPDLLDWDSLYLSGRLQKPVVTIHQPKRNDLKMALDVNLKSAIHCALLQLPETFTVERLFETVTGLSYHGDFRTYIGEDRNKIKNIVRGSFPSFVDLYEPILEKIDQIYVNSEKGTVMQEHSVAAAHHHLELLPRAVLWRLEDDFNRRDHRKNRDLEEILFAIAHRPDYSVLVASALRSIVRKSSCSQSVKNAVTAGLAKTVVYSSRKVAKTLRSLRR